jgi:hypothetical protein
MPAWPLKRKSKSKPKPRTFLEQKKIMNLRNKFRLLVATVSLWFISLVDWIKNAVGATRETVEFANIAEGQSVTGMKAYIADAAIANRYSIVIFGSDQYHCAIGAANTEAPLGVATDSVATADLSVPINVAVFGACVGTQKVVLGGTVAAGDYLQSNGDGTAIKLKTTTGTWYKIGRALAAGVSGDTIEFAPCLPDSITI